VLLGDIYHFNNSLSKAFYRVLLSDSI